MLCLVERLRLPFRAADLVHSDGRAELLGQFGKHSIPFPQDQVARLLGCALIDADSAPSHLVHHRQQIDLKPIGVSCVLAIEDRIEVFIQR